MLKPETQKVGERWLVTEAGYMEGRETFELKILEWSPSNKYVKLELMRGHYDWYKPEKYMAVEKLSSMKGINIESVFEIDIIGILNKWAKEFKI